MQKLADASSNTAISLNKTTEIGVCNNLRMLPSVLELVREDVSFEEIIDNYYSDLEIDDIRACVQYAIDVVKAEDIHISASAEIS